MKKQEIYVPIANKKEAKQLKAMLEKLSAEVVSVREAVAMLVEDRKLALEQIEISKSNVEEKIAVRVENEKEFNALMRYYDSLGYNAKSGRKTTELSYITFSDLKPSILVAISDGILILPNFDGYKIQGTEDYNPDNYKIIPFSEFAKEHGIKVPLLVSEEGVEIFEGDTIVCVNKEKCYIGNDAWPVRRSSDFLPYMLYFSTQKAAFDWIEAQKPKVISVNLYHNFMAEVSKEYIQISHIRLSPSDLEDLSQAYSANFGKDNS